MNFIANWLLEQLTSMFGVMFQIVAVASVSLFENEIVVTVMSIFKMFGSAFYVVSTMILLLKTMRMIADGEQIALLEQFGRIVIGAMLLQYGVELMVNFYGFVLSIAAEFLGIIGSMGTPDTLNFGDLFADFPSLLTIILLCVVLFYIGKTSLNLLERFWQMFVTLNMMYFYLPQYVQGDDNALESWFKQLVAIALTQIFQALVITTAMVLYTESSTLTSFVIAVGGIVAASNIEKILDRFGLSVGGKLGGIARSGMSLGYYARMLIK